MDKIRILKIVIFISILGVIATGVYFISKGIVENTNTKKILDGIIETPTEEDKSDITIVDYMTLSEVKYYWGDKLKINARKDELYRVASDYSVMLLNCYESPYKGLLEDSFDVYEKDKALVVAVNCGTYGQIKVMCSVYTGVPMGFVRYGSFSDSEVEFFSKVLNSKAIVKELVGGMYGAW